MNDRALPQSMRSVAINWSPKRSRLGSSAESSRPATNCQPNATSLNSLRSADPRFAKHLLALEIMGLVEIRAGAGVFVGTKSDRQPVASEVTGPGPFELLEVRRIMEGEIAALIAPTISDDRLDELDHLVAELEREIASGLPYLASDRRFHEALAAETQNSALVDLVRSYWQDRTSHPLYTRLYEQVDPDEVARPRGSGTPTDRAFLARTFARSSPPCHAAAYCPRDAHAFGSV